MPDPFIAEIRIFAGSFAPRGWALCDGQSLPIAQNTALFALIGTLYGGDGRTTFALPDLRGRVPLFWGQGPGLTSHSQGEHGGAATVPLTPAELPLHSHGLSGVEAAAQTLTPVGNLPGVTRLDNYSAVGSKTLSPMHSAALGPTGTGQPHNNLQPYLALNFIIALQGIFPPRIP